MELQRRESKEFLNDLTTRDQRMMFAVLNQAASNREKLARLLNISADQMSYITNAARRVVAPYRIGLVYHG